jgi:hypothetical protein
MVADDDGKRPVLAAVGIPVPCDQPGVRLPLIGERD